MAGSTIVPVRAGGASARPDLRDGGGRVVGEDLPAGRRAADEEREQAVGLVRRAGELPVAKYEGGIGGELGDRELAERERAHGGAVRIALLVALEGGLPAVGDIAARGEAQVADRRVGLHEGVDVAAIPCVGLGLENAQNLGGGGRGRGRAGRRSRGGGGQRKREHGAAKKGGGSHAPTAKQQTDRPRALRGRR